MCVKFLETGASFGELALLYDKPRLATIICTEDSKLLSLERKPFNRVLKTNEQKKMQAELAFFDKYHLFENVKMS